MKLSEIATVIRSKNAGPFELTFDVMFPDDATFESIREGGAISAESVAARYGIDVADVMCVVFFPPARAVKVTIRRPMASGAIGETDIYGAQQHAPLLDMEV